ncbi:MAG TPA: hypothetical protein VIK14_14550, partial [Ignavibacteria bacterium]
WNEEMVDKVELNPLREYARFGKDKFWKYHQRRNYNGDDLFYNSKVSSEPYEILHEFGFLYINNSILYFILVILGIEYVINLAESEIEHYKKWLIENNGKSPII